jgi:hypothetical protein
MRIACQRLLILALALFAAPVTACGQCWPLVYSLVYGDSFLATLTLLMAPLLVIAAAGATVHHAPAIAVRLRSLPASLSKWSRSRR